MVVERTLVLLKPDCVMRQFMGDVITRFEHAGFKIVGMKMVWMNEENAKKHYTDDIEKRRGKEVRDKLLEDITSGPVVAIVIEGIDAIENIRKMAGTTEPKAAAPGTIRGDYAHISFSYADKAKIPARNIVHASSDKKDAEREIKVWFKDEEIHSYKTVHDCIIY